MTACKDILFAGETHLSSGQDVTVATGYDAAAIGNIMYMLKEHDPKDPQAHDMLDSMGQACKMYAGIIPANQTLVANGNPIHVHQFRLKLVLKSVEETNHDCAELSGVQNATACTEHLDNGCRVHLSPDHPDDVWGWECAACFSPELT